LRWLLRWSLPSLRVQSFNVRKIARSFIASSVMADGTAQRIAERPADDGLAWLV